MSIKNPTLAHFRHFSSLFTNLPFTTVERPLQIRPFMQNKPNLPKAQMNVNLYNTTDYENKWQRTLGENKPNTKPIKPNTKPIKANIMPKQTQYEPNQTQLKPISDYPCVFELAVYNLVLRDGNLMHSMPNGRNFDGENMKW